MRLLFVFSILIVISSCESTGIDHYSLKPEEKKSQFDRIVDKPTIKKSTCTDINGNDIDLDEFSTLRENRIQFEFNNKNFQYTLRSEDLLVYDSSQSNSIYASIALDTLIDGSGNIDISPHFYRSHGLLYIFWRENYLYKSNRQGLFRIVNVVELEKVCEGIFGIDERS